jgi:outer membrane lipoprotein carrier protein
MKSLVAILSFLVMSTTFSIAQDAKAKATLDAVSANLKKISTLKANFSLSISKTKETKKGNISMKGTKYYVSVANGQEIFCDSKTIYTYQKMGNEVTINDFDPNENTFTPTKLLTNFYDKEFKSKYLGEKKVGAATMAVIELIPTKAKQFTKVEILVNKTTNMIASGKIFEKNGNVMSYSISNLQTNAAVADNVFVFDAKKHPGCEVVDLR